MKKLEDFTMCKDSICLVLKDKLSMFGFWNVPTGKIKITSSEEPDTLMNGQPRKTPEEIKEILGDSFPKKLVHEGDSNESLGYWDDDEIR